MEERSKSAVLWCGILGSNPSPASFPLQGVCTISKRRAARVWFTVIPRRKTKPFLHPLILPKLEISPEVAITVLSPSGTTVLACCLLPFCGLTPALRYRPLPPPTIRLGLEERCTSISSAAACDLQIQKPVFENAAMANVTGIG